MEFYKTPLVAASANEMSNANARKQSVLVIVAKRNRWTKFAVIWKSDSQKSPSKRKERKG